MSLRLRLALVAAAAVAIAVIAAATGMFFAVRAELLQQTDSALQQRASDVADLGARFREGPIRPPPHGGAESAGFGSNVVVQLVGTQGQVAAFPDQAQALPVPSGAAAVAQGTRGAYFDDVYTAGSHLRVLVTPGGHGLALELARPLDDADALLARLGAVLGAVVLGGVLLATALGLVVTRAALRPVHRLTTAVEEVTRTQDLTRRVPSGGSDELARLGTSFNTMLAALDASLRSQRQLVADASHELRTPLTSLRTNLELLARGQPEDPEERREMLSDVVGQLERLGRLVADLIDLARDERTPAALAAVGLDDVVHRAVGTMASYWPNVEFQVDTDPTTVLADEGRLERAVMNLLENAAKWSPPGGTVEVSARGGEVVVRDHGPGVSAADAPFVFERFWRAPAARSMPGSGLGLAIVHDVAASHGGSVTLDPPDGTGARFRLRLPSAPSRA
jgi:two-component system sensor histidine kinase MprB